jgi:hypothetical protein
LPPTAPGFNVLRERPPLVACLLLALAAGWAHLLSVVLGAGLRTSGFTVGEIAQILAVAALPWSLMLLWAPLVDAIGTRRRWYAAGITTMGLAVLVLFNIPWRPPLGAWITTLAFAAVLGGTFAQSAAKGVVANQFAGERLGAATGWYVAGQRSAGAVSGALTLWLLTHLPSRGLAAGISIAAAVACGSAILLIRPQAQVPAGGAGAELARVVRETLRLLLSRRGLLIATMSFVPFGTGAVAPLEGAIAPDWRVSSDLLATLIAAGIGASVLGAVGGGWLGTRIGYWRTFLATGLAVLALTLVWAIAPRTAFAFAAIELIHRVLLSGNQVAVFAVILAAAGGPSASSKATLMIAIGSMGVLFPVFAEGRVHDIAGPAALLLADGGFQLAGLAALGVVAWLVGAFPIRSASLAKAEGVSV